jgi:hypothetical protein
MMDESIDEYSDDQIYFKNGKPVHKISFCAFLDILGFTARMEESYEAGKADELLEEFYEIFSNQIEIMKKDVNETLLYFKSFSDNILLAYPQFSNDMESEFSFILWSIQDYQLAMAIKGFFIRGGLSVGKLFIDENNVYGEALIEAYGLENKVAINPMVVLGQNVKELVDHHIAYYANESAPQLQDVLVNNDGQYFINYLSKCIIEGFEERILNINFLTMHRDHINEALIKNADNPQVFSKFVWLASYHNYFCDSLSGYSNYSDKLRVDYNLYEIRFRKINE